MPFKLTVYTEKDIAPFFSPREGEQKIGQSLFFINTQVNFNQALNDAAQFGIKYVLIGIPEDIGPRANCGSGGSELGWQAFLSRFLNMQANRFFASDQILLLGEVDVTDIMARSVDLNAHTTQGLSQLRQLCGEIDAAVEPVLTAIFNAGLEPIVIGGGHNNSFPLLQALATSTQTQVNAVNLDPHADFRSLEGRHSGNGFRYAYENSYLNHYHVIGLHELKNNEAIFNALEKAHFTFDSYQAIKVRQTLSLQDSCTRFKSKAMKQGLPLGIEVDVDSISHMPVSAFTNCGFSVSEAEQFVYNMATLPSSRYLHLCEAAPQTHPVSLNQGLNEAGQILSALVYAYLMGKQAN